ncbi:MAG: methyltransferase domain-containing protein [Acidobacteria bacterium]|nr:methyltransferase domain-containing protein [Acidobacteriota bacterium]MCZ6752759.1 methyltransferase domain-containing protein [Acidobacteriota bacterium]
MSEKLRTEFNQWALDGRGAAMESHHLPFVESVIEMMALEPRDRCLEVGCGEGWASRLLAQQVPEGSVVGLDVSDEMVRNARAKSAACENLMLIQAEAEDIPWQDGFFSKVLCVESFYYYEDPEKALREIYRVMSPGGSVWIVNHLSKENELSLRWVQELKVPVQLLSVEEYGALFERCGYSGFTHRMIPDRSPLPEDYRDASFPDPGDLRRFRELGALVISARKPDQ